MLGQQEQILIGIRFAIDVEKSKLMITIIL